MCLPDKVSLLVAGAMLGGAAALIALVMVGSVALRGDHADEVAMRRQLLAASVEADDAGARAFVRSLDATSAELADRLANAPLLADLRQLSSDPSGGTLSAPSGAGPARDPGAIPSLAQIPAGSAARTLLELRAVMTTGLDRIERAQAEAARQAANRATQAGQAALEAARPTAWPVRGTVTDRYGWRILNGVRDFHTGIDIAANLGTPVRAPKAGRVTWVGWRSGYGGTVIIEHDQGFSTLYAHLSYYATEAGRHVEAGDVIGMVGSTGFSTGPHLHYEIRRFGVPVNPGDYLR